MSSISRDETLLNLSLPGDMRRTIEEAAAALGQSVSEFALSTVVREARQVLEEVRVTRLSARDRDVFLSVLDDVDAEPNAALRTAAQRFGIRGE